MTIQSKRLIKSPKRKETHSIAPLKRGHPSTEYQSWGMAIQKQDDLGIVREVWLSNGNKVWNHAGRLDLWLERMRDKMPSYAIIWGANLKKWGALSDMDFEKGRWPDMGGRKIWLRDIFRWYPDRLDVIIRDVCGEDWDLSAEQAAIYLAHIGNHITRSLKEDNMSLPVSGSHGAARLIRSTLPEPLPPPTHTQTRWGLQSFYGGRFFSKFKGTLKGQFYKYDLVAAYGRILRNLPGGAYVEDKDLDPNGLYCVHIHIKAPSLPFRTHRGVAYPVGRIQGYWGGAELWKAKEAGLIDVEKVVWGWKISNNGFYPFREGVDLLQKRRDQAQDKRAENRRWKMAINSIYGMLVSARGEWAGPFFNPFYGALVTSQVRGQVWDAFGDDYLIQQADAVWTDKLGEDWQQPGWRLEAQADTLVCFRASTYLVKTGLEYQFSQCRLHGFSGNKPEIISNLCRGVALSGQTQHLKYQDPGFGNSKYFFHNVEWGKPIDIGDLGAWPSTK